MPDFQAFVTFFIIYFLFIIKIKFDFSQNFKRINKLILINVSICLFLVIETLRHLLGIQK